MVGEHGSVKTKFPENIDLREKSLLIISTILIEFCFFEDRNRNRRHR